MLRRSGSSLRRVSEVESIPTSSHTMGSPKNASTPTAKNQLSAVPHELVVRSLRRRFWHALQQEDATQALRIYQATRTDWECILLEEEASVVASEDENQSTSCVRRRRSLGTPKKRASMSNIPVMKKQRPAWRTRRSNRHTAVDTSSPNLDQSLSFVKEDDSSSVNVILPQVLKPCDFFIEDDFQPISGPYLEIYTQTSNVTNNESSPRRGGWFCRSAPASSLTADDTSNAWLLRIPQDQSCRTTPLHEAARIGSGDLVRCLLEWAGGGDHNDSNIKNGLGRTPLHAAAGGLTREEATVVTYQDELAILAPHRQQNADQHRTTRPSSAPRFRVSSRPKARARSHITGLEQSSKMMKVTDEILRVLASNRMDACMALLTSDASTNVVDQHGRTPLHYAAALGRTDMAFALFNSFGTLLTVVDGFSRTPAECADLHGHSVLAARLEARALLYMDPLDMDLLESLLQQNNGQTGRSQTPGSLTPPFAWFTTFSSDRVQKEREFRIRTTLDRMKKIVERLNAGRSGRDLLFKTSTSSRSDSNELSTHSSHSDSSSPVPVKDLSSLDGLNEGSVSEFLIQHEWDVKQALAAFYDDPVGSISQAKIHLAQSCAKKSPSEEVTRMCLICCEEFNEDTNQWRDLNCGHGFCVSCLGDFITSCAKSRERGLAIRCPHHECSVAMSLSEVSDLTPTKEIKDMMTETANNNFVEVAKDFRFCPHQGCANAVKFIPPKNKPSELHKILSAAGAVCSTPESHAKRKENSPFITYEGIYDESYFDCHSGVQPRRAHRFCFLCGESAHWPVSCHRLEQWKAKVEENIKAAEADEGDDYNEVSHKLWLKANTRPCPKCKAPIEKNDGCNHMTCSNPHCKHEFCWICRNDWSLHGTSTGGFFRCNRWAEDGESHQYYDSASSPEQLRTPTEEDLSDPRRMRAIYGTAMHESRVAHRKSREMARFLHHYQRFSAHADSARLETNMAETCAERLKPIVVAAIEFSGDPAFNFGGKGLSFVYDAFTELRECRSVLQHSYAFSYFRYARKGRSSRNMRRKLAEGLAFEQMQSDLEMITEQMSDLVARAHMRATQSQILYLTLTAAQKRRDFSSYMMRVLAKSKEEGESSEDERSDGDTMDRATPAARLPFFRPIIAPPEVEGTFITGLAPRGEISQITGARHRHEGFFGDLGTDPALRASIQAFRETTGAMDMLRLNTSYDSQDSDDDDVYEGIGRHWTCAACTFINTRGSSCAMCGTFNSNG